jgi:hypothetical protein
MRRLRFERSRHRQNQQSKPRGLVHIPIPPEFRVADSRKASWNGHAIKSDRPIRV